MAYVPSSDPQTRVQAFLSPFGDTLTAEPTRLFGANFEGAALSSVYWTQTTAGTGAVTLSGAVATLNTGATANSRILITSTKTCRFLSGNANRYQVGLRVPDTGAANNIRRWGLFTANDGMFFELNGTTLRVVTRKAGVDTEVASTSWTGNAGTTYTLNTNYHTYDMVYSGATVRFYIDRVLVHSITGSTTTWTGSYNLPIAFENVNSGGGTANVNLETRTVACSRLGKANSRPMYVNISANGTTTLKTQAGNLHRITINTAGASGNTITIYDNTAASGTVIATINSVTTVGSVFEYDVDFNIGLTIVVATGTAANITVIYD